jgi:NADH-quinone oxidoreductase subunit F
MKRLKSVDALLGVSKELAASRDPDRVVVTLCGGTGCTASGSGAIKEAFLRELEKRGLTGKIDVKMTGCHGFCEQGPVCVILPSKILYTQINVEDVSEIVGQTLVEGKIVERLLWEDPQTGEKVVHNDEVPFYKKQKRIVLRDNGRVDPTDPMDYIGRGGYTSLAKALKNLSPEEVIGEVEKSGLRGRGGAGFPTGRKWRFSRGSAGDKKYLVCNADEGDPGAFMDRSLLEGNTHLVVEGMIIGAYAIGCDEGYVYVRAEYPLATRNLRKAIEDCEDLGLLGDNILGTDFSFHLKIKEGAGAFVCGEETALLASIEGKRGMPRPRPPFPAQSGLHGCPTNINNVETFANVPIIIRDGGEEYAKVGTDKSKGTKIFSLTGKINNTGLIEVPMGIKLGEIIFGIGGGVPKGKKLKAVQTGGPSGGCVPASLLNLPVDYESLAEAGSIMGSGGMVVMDEDTCMVDMARYFLGFTHAESCGKCMPCRLGTKQMLEVLEDICQGRGRADALQHLETLCDAIQKGSLCGLGQTSVNPVRTTLKYFRSEYDAHIREKRCPAVACTALFSAPCQHACPVGMDIPAYVALVREGRLDDAYKVLLRTNPFPAVCGRVCDHPCQAKCRRGTLDEPVGIRTLKRYITDNASVPRVRRLSPVHNERVAIIGAGPAGLTAAGDLQVRGYGVTVFEALPEPGGMLKYGIPAYRLPKDRLKKEIDAILHLGVELRTGTRVGRDVSWYQILEEYDAVFLAAGAQRSTSMGVKGEDLDGVMGAVEFLREANSCSSMDVGERVVVVGGGNSAVDAARTALRLGAADVHILYRRLREDMPAQKEEIEEGQKEGVKIHLLVSPVEIVGANGRVEEVVYHCMAPGEFDSSGRRRPVPVSNEQFSLKADQVLMAVGQSVEMPFTGNGAGVEVSRRGLVTIRKGTLSRTSHPRVFAGGDVVTGPWTVVRAIAAGHGAAAEIDASLRLQKQDSPYAPSPEEEIPVSMELEEEVIERPQEPMPLLPVKERLRGFPEVELGYIHEQAFSEACRCLRCDIQVEEETKELGRPGTAAGHGEPYAEAR